MCTKRPCNILWLFWNADSVPVVSSSSGSGHSYTEYVSCIFEATFFTALCEARPRMWYVKCPLYPTRVLGGAVSSPSASVRSPAAERYLLNFSLKMLLVTAISSAYARKNTRKFDKLRDLFYVHSKPTFTGEQSRQIRSTLPRPGSSW